VRLPVVLIVAGLLVAACAGNEKSVGTTATQAPPPDPGRDAARALVEAAQARDTSGLRNLLTERAAARPATVASLIRELRPFEAGYRVIVSERITERYGVVAIVQRQHAYSAARSGRSTSEARRRLRSWGRSRTAPSAWRRSGSSCTGSGAGATVCSTSTA
jgi:hypothetical protein